MLSSIKLDLGDAVKIGAMLLTLAGAYYTLKIVDHAMSADIQVMKKRSQGNQTAIKGLVKELQKNSTDVKLLIQQLKFNQQLWTRDVRGLKDNLNKIEKRTRGMKVN